MSFTRIATALIAITTARAVLIGSSPAAPLILAEWIEPDTYIINKKEILGTIHNDAFTKLAIWSEAESKKYEDDPEYDPDYDNELMDHCNDLATKHYEWL